MKSHRLNRIVVGTALVLTAAGISHAGPRPDLMNSIHRLRLEAQMRAKADIATSQPASAGATCWSWSRTRNITAGQGSVAVPDLSHRVVAEGTPREFKLAPFRRPDSRPENK